MESSCNAESDVVFHDDPITSFPNMQLPQIRHPDCRHSNGDEPGIYAKCPACLNLCAHNQDGALGRVPIITQAWGVAKTPHTYDEEAISQLITFSGGMGEEELL